MNITDSTSEEMLTFLRCGGYATVEEWALDSDYTCDADGTWRTEDGVAVDLLGCIEGAMESLETPAPELEEDDETYRLTPRGQLVAEMIRSGLTYEEASAIAANYSVEEA